MAQRPLVDVSQRLDRGAGIRRLPRGRPADHTGGQRGQILVRDAVKRGLERGVSRGGRAERVQVGREMAVLADRGRQVDRGHHGARVRGRGGRGGRLADGRGRDGVLLEEGAHIRRHRRGVRPVAVIQIEHIAQIGARKLTPDVHFGPFRRAIVVYRPMDALFYQFLRFRASCRKGFARTATCPALTARRVASRITSHEAAVVAA